MKLADIKRLKPGTIITITSYILKGEECRHPNKNIPRVIHAVKSNALLIDLPEGHEDYGKSHIWFELPKGSEVESTGCDSFTIVRERGTENEYRLSYRVETHN